MALMDAVGVVRAIVHAHTHAHTVHLSFRGHIYRCAYSVLKERGREAVGRVGKGGGAPPWSGTLGSDSVTGGTAAGAHERQQAARKARQTGEWRRQPCVTRSWWLVHMAQSRVARRKSCSGKILLRVFSV